MSSQRADKGPFLLRGGRSSAAFVGLVLGLIAITLFMPGGYDAGLYYLRPWYPEAQAPAWVYLLTAPLRWFPWPLPWTLLVVLNVLGGRWALSVWGERRWWLVFFSVPMFWNLWLGQIEVFPVVGAALGWLVVQRKLHPAWLGVAALALATKVQVGWGIGLLFAFWVWREQGWRALFWGGLIAGALFGLTLLAYPGWVPLYIASLERLAPQTLYFNASPYPYGMLAWLIALWPRDLGRARRVRLVAAATLLSSPYFATYHTTTLMTLNVQPLLLPITWLTVVPAFFMEFWHAYGWLIPVGLIALEGWQSLHKGRDNA